MKHYVFLKFKPGCFSNERVQEIKNIYEKISSEMEEVTDIQIQQNCVDRDTNMDLMICITLLHKNKLSLYLEHPLHKDMANRMEPYVETRFSFDC